MARNCGSRSVWFCKGGSFSQAIRALAANGARDHDFGAARKDHRRDALLRMAAHAGPSGATARERGAVSRAGAAIRSASAPGLAAVSALHPDATGIGIGTRAAAGG